MKFEEYVIGEINKLCGRFDQKIKESSSRRSSTRMSGRNKSNDGNNPMSLQSFKNVWKSLKFSRIHYVSVKDLESPSETVQIIYAIILLKIRSCLELEECRKDDRATPPGSKNTIIALLYTLATVYYTQTSVDKEPIRIRISDYKAFVKIQEKYISVESGVMNVIELLFANGCFTIASYIGPSGYAQSMKTLTNDWKAIMHEYATTRNSSSSATTSTSSVDPKNTASYVQTKQRVRNRLDELINVDEISACQMTYGKSLQKMFTALKRNEQSNSKRTSSGGNNRFMRPFRSVHGKAAGHVSSRNVSYNRLKREMRYCEVYNPENKRFKGALNEFNIHVQKEKIAWDLKNRED